MASFSNLPDHTSTNLIICHPTSDEKLHQWKLNSAEWRGALPHEAYLRREEMLSNQALTRDDGITYWILVDETATHHALEPTSKSRLPLASCESYRKKAFVWKDGEVRETICHGIGSVYCAPQLRGRRYAQRMMQGVGEALRTHQTDDTECFFSILYSDIGKAFYAKCGWEPFTSSHLSIPARVSGLVDRHDVPIARPLHAKDVAELCAIDQAMLRETLEARPQASNIAVALVPDVETMQWHHSREEFVAGELYGREPDVKGAIVGNKKGERAWMYWTRVWTNTNPHERQGNTLHILRLVFENHVQAGKENVDAGSRHLDENMVVALMLAAQEEAQRWTMEQVEMWNPSEVALAAAQKLHSTAKLVQRDRESIASLKWYPEHAGPVASSIDWVCNERYAWC
ncbi:unnamed protein product [Periconia digitata]|uniref:LYC1 C-terminal domain-containing protein n=1 Tax=Periconia digitata TaxID=1303443 RepID=A0A9W4U218_9PLEO|nr:unnamed protein product [Periconia digitata]